MLLKYFMTQVYHSPAVKGKCKKTRQLVFIDRKSRRYIIELFAHVTQDDVVAALKRMIARKALSNIISITTDNGCEFLDPDKIKSVVGYNVYYTRAYASWEKGSVENCNKLVRRWNPASKCFFTYFNGGWQFWSLQFLAPPEGCFADTF